MTLRTAPLGNTGMDISRVGFGTWAIGGGAGSSAGAMPTTACNVLAPASIRRELEDSLRRLQFERICEAIGHVDSLQPPFSMIHRAAAADLLPWAVEHNAGVIVYSPMQSGLLTGAMTVERVAQMPDADWRRSHEDFNAWVLSWPGVTGAMVGARSTEQVDGWLPAAALELTEQDLAELSSAIGDAGAGEGPAEPPA